MFLTEAGTMFLFTHTFPSGVSFQMTEKVSLSVRGFRLHSSSHSSLGSMGTTLSKVSCRLSFSVKNFYIVGRILLNRFLNKILINVTFKKKKRT